MDFYEGQCFKNCISGETFYIDGIVGDKYYVKGEGPGLACLNKGRLEAIIRKVEVSQVGYIGRLSIA